MRVYDTSAIYDLIDNGNVIDFDDGATIELSKFEVGNVIRKQFALRHKISMDDALVLVKAVTIFLGNLRVLEPDPSDTLKFAIKEKITFYDASYIVAAMQSQSILVTEDKVQQEVARKYLSVEGVKD
jgi:predicted nucleic acid-binding protein